MPSSASRFASVGGFTARPASRADTDIWSLIAFRFLLGVGIGVDYPISASYIAETMPARSRGRWLIGGFGSQAVGALFGALVGFLILEMHPEVDAWRYMLAVGVLPAIAIAILRIPPRSAPSAHGLASGSAKLGAALGLFRIASDDLGLTETLLIIAVGMVVAFLVTLALRIEPRGQTLEQLDHAAG